MNEAELKGRLEDSYKFFFFIMNAASLRSDLIIKAMGQICSLLSHLVNVPRAEYLSKSAEVSF